MELPLCVALGIQAVMLERLGDIDRACLLLEEVLAIGRRIGSTPVIANASGSLGATTMLRGDFERARGLLEESRAMYRELGNRVAEASLSNDLGWVLYRLGEHERAIAEVESTLETAREFADPRLYADAHASLGWILSDTDDEERAMECFTIALAESMRIHARMTTVDALEGCGRALVRRGDATSGVALLGAAEALRRTMGIPRDPTVERILAPVFEAARERLGEDGYSAALERGQAMGPDEAVAVARDAA